MSTCTWLWLSSRMVGCGTVNLLGGKSSEKPLATCRAEASELLALLPIEDQL